MARKIDSRRAYKNKLGIFYYSTRCRGNETIKNGKIVGGKFDKITFSPEEKYKWFKIQLERGYRLDVKTCDEIEVLSMETRSKMMKYVRDYENGVIDERLEKMQEGARRKVQEKKYNKHKKNSFINDNDVKPMNSYNNFSNDELFYEDEFMSYI